MTDSVDSQKAAARPASHAKNDFEKDKFILKQLVTKDFKIKYRRSVLGIAWSVLNPLLMMVVMSIVFRPFSGRAAMGPLRPRCIRCTLLSVTSRSRLCPNRRTKH